MRLVHDDVVIGKGAQAIRLRPSLRAGMLLHRDWGMGRLWHGVHSGSMSITTAIIEATAEDPEKARERLARMIEREGAFALTHVRQKLADLLSACFGNDRDAPEADHPADEPGKPLDFDGYFEQLFEIGCGFMEWSPADTYAATPAEILIAQRGKIKLLQAIHGAADKPADAEEGSTLTKNPSPDDGDIPLHIVRDNLASLKALLG